jgi:hypothetical protein
MIWSAAAAFELIGIIYFIFELRTRITAQQHAAVIIGKVIEQRRRAAPRHDNLSRSNAVPSKRSISTKKWRLKE